MPINRAFMHRSRISLLVAVMSAALAGGISPLDAQANRGPEVKHSLTSHVAPLLVILSAPAPSFGTESETTTLLRAAANVRYVVRVRLNVANAGTIKVRDASGVLRTLSTTSDVVVAANPAGRRDIQLQWSADRAAGTLAANALRYEIAPSESEIVIASATESAASRVVSTFSR